MARKPVDLIAAAARPEGRQVIWGAIRTLRHSITVSQIEDVTRIKEATIRTYVRGLERAGYLRKIAHACERATHVPGSFEAAVYELINDCGVEAPRVTRNGEQVTQGRAREQMWRTMRVLREFSWRELAVQASTEEQQVKPEDARDYIKHLHAAGYLACARPAKPGHKPGTGTLAQYRLLPSKYTGPQPPMIQRVKQVFDPNLGRVVWKGGEE